MLQIRNLSFSYRIKHPLLSNVFLDLTRGHIYGLLGKNGAGKSTLLKCMAGLVFPQHGECLLDGICVSRRLPSTLESLYFLAEEIDVPALTPMQHVSSTAGFYPQFNEAEFYQNLKAFNIPEGIKMNQLSHGEQKKTMIAFGIATNTKLLIMDEPTNGLDIPSKVQFRKIIASALTEDRCIVISTHQVRDLDTLIDSVVVLHEQHIILNKSVDEIAEKISFKVLPDATGYTVFYEEETIRGKQVIVPNTTGEYSKIDLELLFTGLALNDKPILNHLNEAHHE